MNIRAISLIALFAASVLLPGCKTSRGALPPLDTTKYNYETTGKFALMDRRAQNSVTCTGLQEGRTQDGRLQVGANIQNLENRRIEVQVQCLFKDVQGFVLDETPWQTLILTENGQETVKFTAMDNKPSTYTVRVRGSR
jgi:hypothetical protein